MVGLLLCLSTPSAPGAPTVDLSQYDPAGTIAVSHPDAATLVAAWSDRSGARYRVQFHLGTGRPLFASLETAAAAGKPLVSLGREVDARYRVTLGTRRQQAGWPYIFFDRVFENTPRPEAFLSVIKRDSVRVVSESPHRLKVIFSTLVVGPYSGDLTCCLFDGSPLIQLQAAMRVDRPWVAYLYDSLLFADFATVAYEDRTGALQTRDATALAETEPGEAAGLKARYRTVLGAVRGGTGTLAVTAPPHAGLYPLDRSEDYGFLQAGKGFIGTKMSYWGDRGYVPWVDAPQGATQRMDAFVLLNPAGPPETLGRVRPYTHGDTFKPIPGHYTMAEHFHPEFTQAHLNGKDTLTPFKQAMEAMGVRIVHPLEFHLGRGRMHPVGDTDSRLAELRDMYALFREGSDTNILFIPGEEYNEFFGGHWTYLFPHPVYFTGWRGPKGRAYRQTNIVSGGVTFPVVYQIGDAEGMARLLREEGGLAWTAHPRVKDSQQAPDKLVGQDFYRDPMFLAGDWKAMPADLSKDRLGFRGFALMDDTAQWGYRKSMPGAVDTFEMDPAHEAYGYLNVNYLALPTFPSPDDWSNVVDCLRQGRFFTSTGELLIHRWQASAAGVTAEVEWTFPPAFAEVIWGGADGVHRQRRSMAGEREFGRCELTVPADLSRANWVRFEIWDVARDGAFTQPYWLREPASPKVVAGSVTGFTLIDTDADAPVPGYDPIAPGGVLELAKLPAHLTIRANISPLVMEAVEIDLDGAVVTRTQWPYCLADCAIKPGLRGCPFYDYTPSQLSLGVHVLTATPRRGATRGAALRLPFVIIPRPTGTAGDR